MNAPTHERLLGLHQGFRQGLRRERSAFGAAILVAVAVSALLLQCPGAALAKKRRAEPDPVGIAAVLLESGDAAKALEVLNDVDTSDEDLDRLRFHTLRGIAALQAGQHELAARSLEQAIALSAAEDEREPDAAAHNPQLLEVYLAYARFGLDDCERALSALDRAGPHALERARSFLIRGECERRAERYGAALAAFRDGQARFTGERALVERELLLLVELGLYREMLARARPFLEAASADQGLMLLEALREQGAHNEAIALGEAIRLRHPGEKRVALALAHAYVASERPLAAARLFEQVSYDDPMYASEAAELYRRAGWTELAVLVSARSPDATKKLRQRFGLLLEGRRFEEAAALAPRLSRLGLLEDDELRYALAYAQVECRRFDEAERALKGIDDPAIFRQAAELRRAIASCRQEGWQCR